MRKVLFLTALLAFVFTSSVWAADISGTWALKMTGPNGAENFDVVIKDAGGKLTITGTHPQLKEFTGTGTLNGDAITMSLKFTAMPVEFAFIGKVTGNMMAGTKEINVSASAAGGQGGGASAAGGQGGGAPAAGGQGGGAPAAGGQGGGAPAAGGQGGGAPAAGGQGGGGASTDMSKIDKNWTAEKK
jgi:hypothetical protein